MGGSLEQRVIRMLGRYELLEQVGSGGMAVVYRGRDLATGKMVELGQAVGAASGGVLVALLVVYHWLCGRHWIALRDGRNTRSARYFRVFNELPTLILVAVVGLTIVKPF